jgi:hypothetical protein
MVSTNIAKFKKLLQDNWKIFKIHVLLLESTVEVDLVRGKETEHFRVDNDTEFTVYISHFKEVQDEFGNSEFIYIEDLEEYNKRRVESPQKRSIPQKPYKVSIGERELNGVRIVNLIPPGQKIDFSPASFGAAEFFVDLSQNPNYCDIDLRDQVDIIWTDTNEYAFTGFTYDTRYNKQLAQFTCFGAARRLNAVRLATEITGLPAKGLVEDAYYFMASSVGLRIDFNQREPNLNPRDFIVIFPVEGLDTSCDFKIGDVVFTSNIHTEISDQARTGSTFTNAPWSSVKAFAKVVLEAKHFYQALREGEEKAQRAVDWIQFRTDLTMPCIYGNNEEEKVYYSLEKNYSRFNLVRYGLVIDPTNKASIFHRLDQPAGHSLVIKYDPDEFLVPIGHILNKLDRLSAKEDEEIRALYHALHWLTLSYERESPTDNLLQLWMALEFICFRVTIPEVIQKDDLKKVKHYVKKSSGVTLDQKGKLINAIGKVNQPSTLSKFYFLLDGLGVKLTELEKELIRKLRDARNDIAHGDEITDFLSIEDIEKFRSILERVFVLKIKNL